MFGRFAWLTTVIVAALSPVVSRAQPYDSQMPAPYALPGYETAPTGMYGGEGPYTYGRTRYTQLPDDKGFAYGDTDFEQGLKETFRHAFFRLEYLNWNMKDPGDVVLGSQILSPTPDVNNRLQNTRLPFDLGFPGADGPRSGFGISPTLDGIKGVNNNGIRGTWGFRFEPFSLEASVFALQTARGTVVPYGLPVSYDDSVDEYRGTFIIQGMLENNQLHQVNRAFDWVYDLTYQASLQTGVWGAESNVVLASVDTGGPFLIKPLFGVKFFNFNERLNQTGAYRDPLDPQDQNTATDVTVLTRQINAATQNYLYGPQIGTRIELESKWLTLGFEPKMMFGVNSLRSSLYVQNTRMLDPDGDNILEPVSETQNLKELRTTFGPVADLQVYARGRLSDHMNVFVAYNLLWAGLITRPGNNIVYNLNSDGSLAFQQDLHFTDMVLQGVSVGGEVSW